MSKMKEVLFKSLKILPTDYEDYGGEVKRWKDPNLNYPDCSSGCSFFVELKGSLGFDWGVCSNPNGPRKGLLTWEHQAGFGCFEGLPVDAAAKDIAQEIAEHLIKGTKLTEGCDLSDLGNEIGIALAKRISKNLGYDLESFISGVKHGVSLIDGTH
jgi:hypothetical protein